MSNSLLRLDSHHGFCLLECLLVDGSKMYEGHPVLVGRNLLYHAPLFLTGHHSHDDKGSALSMLCLHEIPFSDLLIPIRFVLLSLWVLRRERVLGVLVYDTGLLLPLGPTSRCHHTVIHKIEYLP